jgi:hypothetical protein
MCKFTEAMADWLRALRGRDLNRSTPAGSNECNKKRRTSVPLSPSVTGWQRLWLAHPFLIPALTIAVLYAQNVGESELLMVLRLVAIALAATTGLLFLARLAMRNWVQAALVVSVFNLLFIVYGRLFKALAYEQKRVVMAPATWHAVLLSFSLATVFVTAVLLRQSRRDWRPLSKFLTSMLTIVLALNVWNIAVGERNNSAQFLQAVEANVLSANDYHPATPLENDSEEMPDVYYIILDAYTRADVLEQVFAYDNSPFVEGLKSRGFYVAEDACSNYPFTFMSLSSSLNMRYLDKFISAAGQQANPSQRPFNKLIQNALAPRVFQSKGYRYVHIASACSMTQSSDIADTVIGYYPSWLQCEFTQVLFRTTALRVFEPTAAQVHLYAFEQLKAVPKIPGPTFTFAHIVCPHNPIVFNCNGPIARGQSQDMRGMDRLTKARSGYVGQVQYVNKCMMEVVDAILAQSKTPPIIIIHGDHGTATLGQSDPAEPLKNKDLVCRERLPILNAYLVPEKMREKLYPTISPVNTFRMLLTECFGENFPLLPDRNLMGWYNTPYELTDMTEWVHSQGAPTLEEVDRISQSEKKPKPLKVAKKPKKTKSA